MHNKKVVEAIQAKMRGISVALEVSICILATYAYKKGSYFILENPTMVDHKEEASKLLKHLRKQRVST